MIDVTRLGGGALVINIDLILSIEQTPDTMIVFANGEKLLVLETPAVHCRTSAGVSEAVHCLRRGWILRW